ncbi:lysozyme inhibitor LprI family protein [Paraburkholderia sp. BCC1885]|uniref:lysozyme inhibitor LprI family protein n=1 Tax=Paraburkholderia sp. BCC1885 TaxID=2562669 RepID=UPI001183E14D|nr:hypothetical protein [Paraburkholderia sp. BCC1885]
MSKSNTASLFIARLLARPSASLSICILAVCATFAGAASAASFHCTSKSSVSEKIVCNDPQLSSLDDRLATAYQRARDASIDPTSVESARIQQWLWRQHNCTDTACVQNWYERRIAELDADYDEAKHARHDAFEAALVEQKLAPSAADAVRQMKSDSLVAAGPLTNPATK